jgi:hypothetical protein
LRYHPGVAVDWKPEERARVEQAIARNPVDSGRCAVLARRVLSIGLERDPSSCARHIRPRTAARYVVPKLDPSPRWGSHTYAEVHAHGVDALTGAPGTAAAAYLEQHWKYAELLVVEEVDADKIDPGLQELQ